MTKSKNKSVWENEEVSRTFLESERGAIPGEELQMGIIGKIAQQWYDNPSKILDLGCGNGILGSFLLDIFPSASGVFVDFSETMLNAAHDNLGNSPRSMVIKADFSTPEWANSVELYKPFDIIISGFAIHHQPDTRKRELYSEIYNLLSQGGVFLNLEHVASGTPGAERLFEEFYADHLYNFQSRHDNGISREAVLESIVKRPDKEEDILTLVDTQCSWLREIGFGDVDCFFKLFEIALFGGKKTEEGPGV